MPRACRQLFWALTGSDVARKIGGGRLIGRGVGVGFAVGQKQPTQA